MKQEGQVIIYVNEEGDTRLNVLLEDETVWLSQAQICELYQTSKSNVSEHIKNIFVEGELDENSVVRKNRTTASDGKTYQAKSYNLDMIISLGYRIKSIIATRFRQWATARLKEYMIKGFTLDDERLKNGGGGAYWKELLDRIRDIRSSEKVMYRQVLDLYATAIDYDPKSPLSITFFKMVQNKLHYATHGQTAAEVIFNRVDSGKVFVGLTTFKGSWPTLADAKIAKNYLTTDELKILNNLVSGYFDLAELQAMRRKPMYMEDYIRQLDNILSSTGEQVLTHAGTISHQQAMTKAENEYKKWQQNTLSPAEKDYLQALKELRDEAKELKPQSE